MQEKQGIASVIDCTMNTNLSWSTTSWTPIFPDQLHHEHQSFQMLEKKQRIASLINYIMNTWTPIYPNAGKKQNSMVGGEQTQMERTSD